MNEDFSAHKRTEITYWNRVVCESTEEMSLLSVGGGVGGVAAIA